MIVVFKLLDKLKYIDYEITFVLNEQATSSEGRKLKVKQYKKDVRKHFSH